MAVKAFTDIQQPLGETAGMLCRVLALVTALSTIVVSSAYAASLPPAVGPGNIAQAAFTSLPAPPSNVVNINGSTPDWKPILKQALSTPNMTVYLASNVDLDLSGEASIPIAQGVTIMGGQPCPLASMSVAAGAPTAMPRISTGAVATPMCGGRTPANPGPRLYTTTRPDGLLVISCLNGNTSDGVRLSGFRVQGPDWDQNIGGNDHLERGIRIESCNGVEIANMELSGWAGAAVRVTDPAGRRQNGPEAVQIHDSFIHHNQHTGREGYGVDVSSGGWALIERNVFDFNRHAVTHGYIPPAAHMGGYTANENLVLKGGGWNGNPLWETVQQFDVHGDANCPFGISGLWDCGKSGQEYQITNNAFQYTTSKAFLLRGTPLVGAFVNNNVFAQGNVNDAVGTAGFGTSGLNVGSNTTNLDSFGSYGVCDMEGDGHDDLFLATGASWWYMSSAKQHWVYLNSYHDTIDQIALGDFEGTGRCDVFAVHGDEWLISSGGSSPWRSLGHFGVPFDQLRFGHFTGSNRTEIFRRDPNGQWWIISPGVFDWTPLASSSLPLNQLHFGNFSGRGITDVIANVNGYWSVSCGGRSAWYPLNPNLSDSLGRVLIADLDGKGTDDVLRIASNGQLQVSVGGRTSWQPLVQVPGNLTGGWVGHFDGSRGAQVLAVSWPEGIPLSSPDDHRRSQIFSRTTGTFTPYGKYSY
jgi:hypothetical protein